MQSRTRRRSFDVRRRMQRPGRRSAGLIIGCTLGVLAGCGSGESSTTPSDQPVLAIDGVTFVSETVIGHDVVAGSALRVSFDGDRLGADAGCNQIGGEFQITAGVLVVDQLAMTEMACMDPPGLMEQEQWFSDFLSSQPSIRQDGDRLTLATDDVSVVFLDREIAPTG